MDNPGACSDDWMQEQEERIEHLHDAFECDFSTLDPPEDLSCWSQALEDGDVDPFVAGELSNLAARDEMGKAEATRVLHHLMKPGQDFKKGPSRWAHSAIGECIEYPDNWAVWESKDPHKGATKIKANHKDPRASQDPEEAEATWELREVAVPR